MTLLVPFLNAKCNAQIVPTMTVNVTNDLPSGKDLAVHCVSRDAIDDLGEHVIHDLYIMGRDDHCTQCYWSIRDQDNNGTILPCQIFPNTNDKPLCLPWGI